MSTKAQNRLTLFKIATALSFLWLFLAAFPFVWTFWGLPRV